MGALIPADDMHRGSCRGGRAAPVACAARSSASMSSRNRSAPGARTAIGKRAARSTSNGRRAAACSSASGCLPAELGPEWKPDRAKFAMLKSAGGRHLTVFADPGNPSTWRRSPYYENLKHWAAQGVRNTASAPCRCDDRAALHRDSPDRDVELGNLGSDEMIHLACRNTAAGVVIDASKIKRTPAAA